MSIEGENKKDDDSGGTKPTVWAKDHENILIDWADKAMCYRWLHAKANQKFKKLNTWFTVPVIIMSTITGTANFASEKVPVEYRSYYSSIIGGVNIIAGIITTVQQFLKISELNEAHRVSSISWDKFYRKIRVELAKPPKERQNVYDFLKACTEEFDRLMETSPSIDKYIIQKFNTTFNNKKLDKETREMFKQLKKPEICDILESVKFSIYQVDEFTEKKAKFKNLLTDVINTLDDKELPNKKMKLIDEFYNRFKEEMLREPTRQDLIDNLQDETIGITTQLIDLYLNNKKKGIKNSIQNMIQNKVGVSSGDIEMGMQGFNNMKNDIENELDDDEEDHYKFDNSKIEIANDSDSSDSTVSINSRI